MVMGLERSQLTSAALRDSGASSTFTAGEVLRSSAEILASLSANSCKSKVHGAAAGTGVAVSVGGAAGTVGTAETGGVAETVGAAGTVEAATAAGDGSSLSKLNEPSGSSQVTSFTPVRDSDST